MLLVNATRTKFRAVSAKSIFLVSVTEVDGTYNTEVIFANGTTFNAFDEPEEYLESANGMAVEYVYHMDQELLPASMYKLSPKHWINLSQCIGYDLEGDATQPNILFSTANNSIWVLSSDELLKMAEASSLTMRVILDSLEDAFRKAHP